MDKNSITYLHNSNRKQRQTTLTGETIENEKFTVIGFVPIEVIGLRTDIWFWNLDNTQIKEVSQYISSGCIREKVNTEKIDEILSAYMD